MLKIYETLKNLISPELISKAAATLGESNSKVSTAISATLPSLLGKLLKDGDTPRLREVVETAGKKDVYNDLHNVFTGSGIYDNINIGERFQNALLGTKSNDFVSEIASKAGITAANADRISNWVAGAVAAYLGHKVVNGTETMPHILTELSAEKNSIMNDIPSNIYSLLGLSSVFGNRTTTTGTRTSEPVKKNGNGWIVWLIIALLLLFLLFFWWRSCNRNEVRNDYRTNNTAVTAPDTTYRTTTYEDNDSYNTSSARLTEFTLPDGKTINIYKNGTEEMILNYLNNDYKTASADDVKNRWFDFDNIEFRDGSSDDLADNSRDQLNNIAAILKNYPDTKIRLASFTDSENSQATDVKLSEERANYIKAIFERAGVNGNRIQTEGFADEQAHFLPGDDFDADDIDGHIALRFVK